MKELKPPTQIVMVRVSWTFVRSGTPGTEHREYQDKLFPLSIVFMEFGNMQRLPLLLDSLRELKKWGSRFSKASVSCLHPPKCQRAPAEEPTRVSTGRHSCAGLCIGKPGRQLSWPRLYIHGPNCFVFLLSTLILLRNDLHGLKCTDF